MSPEQARGKAVDKRTDIWAFGCVLFEMLTGARAFAGDDVTDTIVSVVSKEPAWETLPPNVAPEVRRLLARCLAKDPKTRLRDIGEARLQLEPLASGVEPWRPVAPATGDASSRKRSVSWQALPWNTPAPLPLVRFTVPLTAALPISGSGLDRDLAMSPDGTRLVYASVDGRLVVRGIDQIEAVPLSGVTDARDEESLGRRRIGDSYLRPERAGDAHDAGRGQRQARSSTPLDPAGRTGDSVHDRCRARRKAHRGARSADRPVRCARSGSI